MSCSVAKVFRAALKSENSRRLWLFVGCVRGFPRKTPGKSRENCWKKIPESRNATNSMISGTGKGKPAANLGSTLPGPCPHLPCGVFFEIDSSSLLEFLLSYNEPKRTKANLWFSAGFPAVFCAFLRKSTVCCEKSALPKCLFFPSQRALLDILMSRGKNCLPTVSRQFLTRNYPRPNCLLKCLPNCLSPTKEGFLSSFKITPAVRVIARQVRNKNCLAAIFAPRHQSVSSGPLG